MSLPQNACTNYSEPNLECESMAVSKAIILVGGWGTRLRPLTYTMPKPLIPFCNKPMLKYQISKLADAGINEVILAINYYSELIMKECHEYEQEYNIRIIYSKEEYPLGTGGPIALAKEYLKDGPFFVMNSDICCNIDIRKMKNEFIKRKAYGMIATFKVKDPMRYGLIKLDKENKHKIISFIEKPASICENETHLINAGVYIFNGQMLDLLDVREISLEKEIFPRLAEKGLLDEYQIDGYWMDVGQIQDYLDGQRLYLENEIKSKEEKDYKPGMLIPEKNVVIGYNVVIGEGVVLENCAIFDGVTIGANSVIKNSIIGWECVIGENCIIEGVSALGKGVSIQSDANISAMRINPPIMTTLVEPDKN